MQKEVKTLLDKVEAVNIKGLEDSIAKLTDAAEKQGLAIEKMKDGARNEEKSFRQLLVENTDKIKSLAESGKEGKSLILNASKKSIVGGAVTSETFATREMGVGQIQRGKTWLRDLFNVVTLGNNSHGSVKWFEQLAITNSAANIAENGIPAAQSDLTWVEKTLSGKRIKDYIKVSKDQIQDIDFLLGEIRTLVDKNMRLKENQQLYTGLGTGNEIKGINVYAPAFITAGVSIEKAGMIDLITKCKTQIVKSTNDGFEPTNFCINPTEADLIRLAKSTDGQYLFPMWALGGDMSISGLRSVENTLVTANSLLVGDFSAATLFEWNGLTIEIGQINDDALTGMVTIIAYMRENLRVKDVDVNAFVKVADVAATITAITAV